MSSQGLTILIPVFNEEKSIDRTIISIDKIVNNLKFEYEVIFINDGSTDKTSDFLKNININKNFKVINHFINKGYGAALKTGVINSKFKLIAITDADETYPNDKILDFYEIMNSNELDMIVGARVGKDVKIPFIRKPPKWLLNKLANYLSGYNIPDLNSGLRIMKKSIIMKFINIIPDGFSFTTTITLAMLTNNFEVQYEKISYFHRGGKSKIRPIYDTLNFLQLIIRTTLYFNPLKIFLPISLSLFLISLILVFYRIFFNESFSVLSVIFFIGSIQFLAIGMLADLIIKKLKL